MNATTTRPTTVIRSRPGAPIGPGRSHHASDPGGFAAAIALATVVLAVIAGGLLGGAVGAGVGGLGSCAPRPIPGGGWAAAAECVAHPLPGSDIVAIMPR